MSQYVIVEGEIRYPSTEELFEAAEILHDEGWMDEAFQWTDEYGIVRETDYSVSRSKLAIKIPHGPYRSLHYVLPEIVEDAVEGSIVAVTTDGMYNGWVFRANGENENYHLKDWLSGQIDEEFPEYDRGEFDKRAKYARKEFFQAYYEDDL